MRPWITACLLVWLTSATAFAQDRLAPDLLQRFGGVYAIDCANPASPKVAVLADALVVEQNKQRMVGRKVQSAYSYYGNSPPPNYQVALLSEVRPGPGMDLMFTVFSDRKGPYITLDGGDKVAAMLGKKLMGARWRHCEAGAPPRAAAPTVAPATPRSATVAERPGDLVRDNAFSARYRAALGSLARERWIARLDGPAPQLRNVNVEGSTYQLVASCKQHDCEDNNLVLLWRQDGGTLVGKVLHAGRANWIGAPTPAQRRVLEQLWRKEWRSGK